TNNVYYILMQRIKAPRKSTQISVIYLTFFLLLSIPLVVYGILNGSFDIRNRAFDDLEVSEENPCIISLPNVNPYTLAVGNPVTIQVDAKLSNAIISELNITDSSGNSIYTEKFDNSPIEIATSFKFTPTKSGIVDLLGIIKKDAGGSVGCKISSPYDILGLRALANNSAPVFITQASSSKPSQNIKTGTVYEYTLSAADEDDDRVNYSYSFTPEAKWLKPTIIEDGSSGKLTIKFTGSTNVPGSYLANVFIHDGYSMHLASQSWVINVSPAKNDIPVVKITSPVSPITVVKGKNITVSWEANDLNFITKYQLYITKNYTNTSSWIAINSNIPFKTRTYSFSTSDLEPGTYKVILKAIDNQTPQVSGLAISSEIVITKTGQTPIPTNDIPIIDAPQVINMTPLSTDQITNKRVTVKASLISAESADIDEKTILFKLDGIDKTSEIKINKISSQEYTIIYQPLEDFAEGIHKAEAYFKDSAGHDVTKEWTFTIQETIDELKDETINIFGLDISKRILLIVGIGLVVVILAIVAPIIIFNVWKEDKMREQEEPHSNEPIQPFIKQQEPEYIEPPVQVEEIKEKVEVQPETIPVEEEKIENFVAPAPLVEETPPPAEIVPPEPDLSTDLPTDESIKQLFEQVQKAQEEPPTTNS
ncbi:MAG: hypothetical protein UR73_C0034G0005, partial [candidate division WS6 bacterium GW2011_GWF1_35_23]